MFRVFCRRLSKEAENLQRTINELRIMIEETDGVIHQLKYLSGMSEVLEQLAREKERAEQQLSALIDLFQALESVLWCYTRAERNIEEYGENNQKSDSRNIGLMEWDIFPSNMEPGIHVDEEWV